MLLAILLSGPVLAATPPGIKPLGPLCRNPETLLAQRKDGPMAVRPLGDEPPAQHILAVLRTDVDGCVRPVVVKAEVGKRRKP